MSAAHTPGPWSVNEIDATGEPSDYYIFIEPGVAVIERKASGECDMPDARLISAAPDLLKALRDLDTCFCEAGSPLSKEDRHRHRMALIAARAAIAAATGAAS